MASLDSIAEKIIQEQALVIGPLAWSEARKVSGLQIGTDQRVMVQNGDPKAAIDRLVAQYERLCGRASHEVCKEAVASLIRGMPQADVPASLLA